MNREMSFDLSIGKNALKKRKYCICQTQTKLISSMYDSNPLIASYRIALTTRGSASKNKQIKIESHHKNKYIRTKK